MRETQNEGHDKDTSAVICTSGNKAPSKHAAVHIHSL